MRTFQVFLVLGLVTMGNATRDGSQSLSKWSPTILSQIPLSKLQAKNPVTLQQNQLQSMIDPLNKALQKNQAEIPGKTKNSKPRHVSIECQMVDGMILCFNKHKDLTKSKFKMVQAHYSSFLKQYNPTINGPMNQCTQECGAFPSTFKGRYQFGCRIQCSCAQVCSDSYFGGRMCEPVEKNNPACCPAACPLNCPKQTTCSYSGLNKRYKCSCLGVTFVDPTMPDENDLYFTTYHGGNPVVNPPIYSTGHREIIGRTVISDPLLDRTYNPNANAYDQYYNAQNQNMAYSDRVYASPTYHQLRYP